MLLKAELDALGEVSSSLRSALSGLKRSDVVAVVAGSIAASSTVTGVLGRAVARIAAKDGDSSARSVPADAFDAALSRIVAKYFAGTAELPSVSTARKGYRSGEPTAAEGFVYSVKSQADKAWKAAQESGDTATTAQKATRLRLTASDLAALTAGRSITVQLSKRQSIEIVPA